MLRADPKAESEMGRTVMVSVRAQTAVQNKQVSQA